MAETIQERNIRLVVEDYYGMVFDKRDLERAKTLFHEDFINRTHPNWEGVRGPAAIIGVVEMESSCCIKHNRRMPGRWLRRRAWLKEM